MFMFVNFDWIGINDNKEVHLLKKKPLMSHEAAQKLAAKNLKTLSSLWKCRFLKRKVKSYVFPFVVSSSDTTKFSNILPMEFFFAKSQTLSFLF